MRKIFMVLFLFTFVNRKHNITENRANIIFIDYIYRMASIFENLFSTEDIEYITQCPEVVAAKAKLDNFYSSGVVYFTIPITESIRNTLFNRLALDFSNVAEIPMRWLKGDMAPHVDTGATRFQNTYLAYIDSSPGQFIVDSTAYPIIENTAFVFNEGLLHKTQNTELIPRLLVGPMNELAEPVGATILYYSNYADAAALNGNYIAAQGTTFVIGDTANIAFGSITPYTLWRVAYVYGGTIPTGVYPNGFDLITLGIGFYTYYLYPSIPCFLEGTRILCQQDGEEVYIPIENVKTGTLVKTARSGYKRVELIGKGYIENPGNDERIENRLYKCSPDQYPELVDDLYITGCHSILVDDITDAEREQTVKQLGRIFVTEHKYRLMASIDERAEPWNSAGRYTIWHIALENEDEKMNYGIYVNGGLLNGGLLVETCSLYFLKNKSNMSIV